MTLGLSWKRGPGVPRALVKDVTIQQSLLMNKQQKNSRMPHKRKKNNAESEKVSPDHYFIFTKTNNLTFACYTISSKWQSFKFMICLYLSMQVGGGKMSRDRFPLIGSSGAKTAGKGNASHAGNIKCQIAFVYIRQNQWNCLVCGYPTRGISFGVLWAYRM